MGASSPLQAKGMCAHGPAGVESRDHPMALQSPGGLPQEEGPAGQGGFLLEVEEGPREPCVLPGRLWEADPPPEVRGTLQGTTRCQHRHLLAGKREFPQEGNFSHAGKKGQHKGSW